MGPESLLSWADGGNCSVRGSQWLYPDCSHPPLSPGCCPESQFHLHSYQETWGQGGPRTPAGLWLASYGRPLSVASGQGLDCLLQLRWPAVQAHPFHSIQLPDASWGRAWTCAAQAEGDRPALTLHDAAKPSAPGPTLLCGARPRGQLQTSPLLTLGQLQGLEGQPVILWGWPGTHSSCWGFGDLSCRGCHLGEGAGQCPFWWQPKATQEPADHLLAREPEVEPTAHGCVPRPATSLPARAAPYDSCPHWAFLWGTVSISRGQNDGCRCSVQSDFSCCLPVCVCPSVLVGAVRRSV